jgi:hypothetical protein
MFDDVLRHGKAEAGNTAADHGAYGLNLHGESEYEKLLF